MGVGCPGRITPPAVVEGRRAVQREDYTNQQPTLNNEAAPCELLLVLLHGLCLHHVLGPLSHFWFLESILFGYFYLAILAS